MTLRARDAMVREMVTIDPDETLAELERVLIAHRISGLPVVEKDRLVGLVSRSDIVRVLSTERAMADAQLDFYRQYDVDPNAPSEVVARALEEDREQSARMIARRMAQLRVRDAMATDVIAVPADAPLREVAKQLVERRVHRLVVTEGDKPVGLVTALDLAKLIAEEQLS